MRNQKALPASCFLLQSVSQILEGASLRIRSCYSKNPTKKYKSLSCLLSRTESKNICFVRKKYTAVIKPEDRNTCEVFY